MAEEIEKNDQVLIIEKSVEIFKDAPKILIANQNRKQKVIDAGNTHLGNWKIANEMEDGEQKDIVLAQVDEKTSAYLVKAKKAQDDSAEARKPITQVMTKLAKMYTECENEIDKTKEGTVTNLLQKERDKYVTYVIKKKEEIERKNAIKKATDAERIDIITAMEKAISSAAIQMLTNKKMAVNNAFAAITLDVYDDRALSLRNMLVVPPVGDALKEKIGYPKLDIVTKYHDAGAILEIQSHVLKDYNFTNFSNNWQEEMTALKNKLVDELLSKKNELLEEKRLADEKEKQRLEQIEIDKKAEEKRIADLAKAKTEKAKKDLLDKQEKERLAEEKVKEDLLAQQKEEEDKRLKEKTEREEADRNKIIDEQKKLENSENLKIDVNSEGAKALGLFDEIANNAELVTPDSKSSYEIEVTSYVGYYELFRFWMETAGKLESNEKIEKKSIGQMITWAEAHAKKTSEKIDSQFVEYKITHKAK